MTDQELMLACIDLMRNTRQPQVLDVCAEVQRRLGCNLLSKVPATPTPTGKRPSRAAYMRAYRNKQRANPFA